MNSTAESVQVKNLLDARNSGVHLSRTIVIGLAILLDALIIAGTGFVLYAIYLAHEPGSLSRYAGVIGLYTILIVQTFHTLVLY